MNFKFYGPCLEQLDEDGMENLDNAVNSIAWHLYHEPQNPEEKENDIEPKQVLVVLNLNDDDIETHRYRKETDSSEIAAKAREKIKDSKHPIYGRNQWKSAPKPPTALPYLFISPFTD